MPDDTTAADRGARRQVRGSSGATPASSEPATRLIDPPSDGAEAAVEDPPVAVLLVISGPGQGRLLPVGHGTNALGRGDDQRVRVDFGDDAISRSRHAVLTYDSRGDRFFLQHGGGHGVTYLQGEPLLEPSELDDGDRITVGATELLFRRLVDAKFNWSRHES